MDPGQVSGNHLAAFKIASERLLSDAECKKAYVRALHVLSEMHSFDSLISNARLRILLRHALKEFQFSVTACSFGLYRQSFAALRLSFELALATILFSSDERRLRSWLRGEADINWQALVDENNGVFAKSFVRVFCEALADQSPQYRTLAGTVYRECSEYVHGNASTHDSLPESIEFSRDVFLAWAAKVDVIRDVIVFCFVARFFDEAQEAGPGPLRDLVIDSLGHHESVRAVFGGVTGG